MDPLGVQGAIFWGPKEMILQVIEMDISYENFEWFQLWGAKLDEIWLLLNFVDPLQIKGFDMGD